jgi:hypothetical protein
MLMDIIQYLDNTVNKKLYQHKQLDVHVRIV